MSAETAKPISNGKEFSHLPAALERLIEAGRKDRERRLEAANAVTPRTAKLSELQKKILGLALKWRGKSHSDVYAVDVKAEVFGFPVMRHYWRGWIPNTDAAPGTARKRPDSKWSPNQVLSGQIFDRQSIGAKRYSAAAVSISKAFKRLVDRNLLYCTGRGWSLTKHGEDVANNVSSATHV